MPRQARKAPEGLIYHVVSRAAGKPDLLRHGKDFAAFIRECEGGHPYFQEGLFSVSTGVPLSISRVFYRARVSPLAFPRIVEEGGVKQLQIAWTDSLGQTRTWLSQVQQAEGGPGSIQEITGNPSGVGLVSCKERGSLQGKWVIVRRQSR
jgi:hypothetical protein